MLNIIVTINQVHAIYPKSELQPKFESEERGEYCFENSTIDRDRVIAVACRWNRDKVNSRKRNKLFLSKFIGSDYVTTLKLTPPSAKKRHN